MGKIKEKLIEISEIVQDLIDDGVPDNEIDYYIEDILTDEEYELYHENKDIIFRMLGYMLESLNEDLPAGTIRVFKTSRMKPFDSHDYTKRAIINVEKTYKLKNSYGNYFVTRVILYDGSKGYVWPDELEKIGINPKTDKRNRFNESVDESYIMNSIFEGCNCGKNKLIKPILKKPSKKTKSSPAIKPKSKRR